MRERQLMLEHLPVEFENAFFDGIRYDPFKLENRGGNLVYSHYPFLGESTLSSNLQLRLIVNGEPTDSPYSVRDMILGWKQFKEEVEKRLEYEAGRIRLGAATGVTIIDSGAHGSTFKQEIKSLAEKYLRKK